MRVVHRPAASVPACRKTQPPVAPPLASLAPGRRGWVRGPPPSLLHVSTGDGVRAPATPLPAGARVAAMCNEARDWYKQEVWASRGERESLLISWTWSCSVLRGMCGGSSSRRAVSPRPANAQAAGCRRPKPRASAQAHCLPLPWAFPRSLCGCRHVGPTCHVPTCGRRQSSISLFPGRLVRTLATPLLALLTEKVSKEAIRRRTHAALTLLIVRGCACTRALMRTRVPECRRAGPVSSFFLSFRFPRGSLAAHRLGRSETGVANGPWRLALRGRRPRRWAPQLPRTRLDRSTCTFAHRQANNCVESRRSIQGGLASGHR